MPGTGEIEEEQRTACKVFQSRNIADKSLSTAQFLINPLQSVQSEAWYYII
ncbi:MAG: hypothetical protein ACI4E5_08060 [Suilimivivens sp.]|nr:hypothetical protein [Lachnospiraceae bacterium]